MIDHISLAVRDIQAAEAFYSAVLTPLGLTKLREWQKAAIGYGKKYPEFWINRRADMTAVETDSGVHVCLRAASTEAVDAFHAAALAGGGSCDGAPGLRPEYHDRYYAAFIRDPDGNRIEAVTFIAEAGSLQPIGGHGGHFLLFRRDQVGCPLQLRQNVLDAVRDEQIETEILADEFEALHVVDECAEGFPEVFDVRKQYRLAMAAKLDPGDLFDHFLKCSYSTWHRNEGIRHFERLALSFVHVVGDDQIVIPTHRMFTRDQKLGNDSCHGTAVIKNRVGDCAHHADGAAAENQPDAIFGENRAEGAGALNKGRIGAGARSAIDANFSDFAAFFDLLHTY